MEKYTTGELAARCGVSVRTVQYYDARGILAPSELSEGGRRIYTGQDRERLELICFLRELGMPLKRIAELLSQEQGAREIERALDAQAAELRAEIAEREAGCEKIEALRRSLRMLEGGGAGALGGAAQLVRGRSRLRRLRRRLWAYALAMGALEIGAIALWIFRGLWQAFVLYECLVVATGALLAKWYFPKVIYLCPHCHAAFRAKLWRAFWAAHTPNTRKLRCPACGRTSYCAETCAEEAEQGPRAEADTAETN